MTEENPAASEDRGARDGGESATWTLRMKDVCQGSGLSRQAVHFYIKEGLLPPGRKTGRNTACYGPGHIERLLEIRRLQHQHFLPLKAIRQVLDAEPPESSASSGSRMSAFSADQRAWLSQVRALAQVGGRAQDPRAAGQDMPLADLTATHGVSAGEVLKLAALGVVRFSEESGPSAAGGHLQIRAEDVWAVAFLGDIRARGFTAEAGFGLEYFAAYARAVDLMIDSERAMLGEWMERNSAPEAAALLNEALPLVHQFTRRYHEARVRRLLQE